MFLQKEAEGRRDERTTKQNNNNATALLRIRTAEEGRSGDRERRTTLKERGEGDDDNEKAVKGTDVSARRASGVPYASKGRKRKWKKTRRMRREPREASKEATKREPKEGKLREDEQRKICLELHFGKRKLTSERGQV